MASGHQLMKQHTVSSCYFSHFFRVPLSDEVTFWPSEECICVCACVCVGSIVCVYVLGVLCMHVCVHVCWECCVCVCVECSICVCVYVGSAVCVDGEGITGRKQIWTQLPTWAQSRLDVTVALVKRDVRMQMERCWTQDSRLAMKSLWVTCCRLSSSLSGEQKWVGTEAHAYAILLAEASMKQ